MALKPNVQTVFNTPHYLDENYPFLYPYICYSKAGKLLLPDQIPCTAGAFFCAPLALPTSLNHGSRH